VAVAASILLAAIPQPSSAQPTGAGTEASRAEQQQRYEQQRTFENYSRTMDSQARFLSVHGFPQSYASSSARYVQHLSRPMRESFVSVTTLAAPKTARKAFRDVSRELAKHNADLERCSALLEQAVAEYPEYAAAWTLLGIVRHRRGNLTAARDAFARAIEADPKFLEPYIEHANFALAEKEWQEAVTVADQLIKAKPLFTLGYYYRAAALLRLGELKDAEEAALKALNTLDDKVFPETHFLLGELYAEQRAYPLAAREYRIYLAEGPSGGWGNYVKGRLKEWELLGIIEPPSKKKRRG
jgi:tetratricopeptide (TPR) repeat protein